MLQGKKKHLSDEFRRNVVFESLAISDVSAALV